MTYDFFHPRSSILLFLERWKVEGKHYQKKWWGRRVASSAPYVMAYKSNKWCTRNIEVFIRSEFNMLADWPRETETAAWLAALSNLSLSRNIKPLSISCNLNSNVKFDVIMRLSCRVQLWNFEHQFAINALYCSPHWNEARLLCSQESVFPWDLLKAEAEEKYIVYFTSEWCQKTRLKWIFLKKILKIHH